jgi:hypothetical protein
MGEIVSKDQNNHSAQYLTHQEIVPILVGLMMGLFLAALDQTIVATSIRTIGDELNGDHCLFDHKYHHDSAIRKIKRYLRS